MNKDELRKLYGPATEKAVKKTPQIDKKQGLGWSQFTLGFGTLKVLSF